MRNRMEEIKKGIGLIDQTQTGIDSQKEVIRQKIREIFGALAKSANEFSANGNLDQVPHLLKELESAKGKIKSELEKLLEQIKSQAGQAGEELQNLVTNLGEQQGDSTEQQDDTTEQQDDTTEQQGDTTEQQGDSTRLTASPTEKKENFETTEDKKKQECVIKFLEGEYIQNQYINKVKSIEYTANGIKIGGVEWARGSNSNNLGQRQAQKSDFERSFEWLFGEKLPAARKNTSGVLEYPWDKRVAVIPYLLGWEKSGRYGQDGKLHGVGKSGFYDLGDNRVLKFDQTGGVVREKRKSDLGISNLYVLT